MNPEELKTKIAELEALRIRLLTSYQFMLQMEAATGQEDSNEAIAKAKLIEYDEEIAALKAQLNNNTVETLKKDLLETGVLDRQKIEDTVKALGLDSIELSEDAQAIKQYQNKVNSIFDKYIGRGN